MIRKECLKCKDWVKYYNANKHHCIRGYCKELKVKGITFWKQKFK